MICSKSRKCGFASTVVVAMLTFGSVALAQSACPSQAGVRQAEWPIPENRGAAGLWVVLQQLHSRASAMMVVAHPDDEDSGTLTYLSRAIGARTALLTLNRGGDGADLMSSDLWTALALVRTEELLHADRYYCISQYFTDAQDFGFSKSLPEAEAKYSENDNTVFRSMVRAVRLYRPLVLMSVFVGGPSDGHGAHQFAGKFAQKVFAAAGDPSVFPDQIKAGLRPWNPLKYYARVPFGLAVGEVSPKGIYDSASQKWVQPVGVQNYISGEWEPGPVTANVEVPVGEYNPFDGLSDQQIGAIGHGFHKSQFAGPIIPAAGPAEAAYHRFATRVPTSDHETSFFQGIDVSLLGIADYAGNQKPAFLINGLTQIDDAVEAAIQGFSAKDPSSIAPQLARGMTATGTLIDQVQNSALSSTAKYNILFELNIKKGEFSRALALSLGLSLSATVAPPHPPTGMMAKFMPNPPTFQIAIPGQTFPVHIHLAEASPVPIKIDDISLHLESGTSSDIRPRGDTSGELNGAGVMNTLFEVQIPENAEYTKPYFFQPDVEQPYYNILEPQYRNLPFAPYPLEATVTATYDNVQFGTAEVVQTVHQQIGYGFVFNPMPIGPPISVSMLQRHAITPLTRSSFPVNVRLHSNVEGAADGSVSLALPQGWTCTPATADFSLASSGQDQVISFTVYPRHLAEQLYTLTAVATYDGHQYKHSYTQVGYPGLRPYFLYREADYKTTGTDVKVAPSLKVGYIEGSGDDVPESLNNIGVHVHFLTKQELVTGNLSNYNIILVGIRAYAVRPNLSAYNSRLLNYVKNGGVVVVQYQTPDFDHDYGPYPYTMTSHPQEVTNEQSHVAFREPASPVLNWPNKISEKDFDGWVEERGSKFMESWDPRYRAPLETHDPGQAPQAGGLLIARYGSGIWVYTAYAFYRQLPFGVPGAYRFFANLVSLPQNPAYRGGGH